MSIRVGIRLFEVPPSVLSGFTGAVNGPPSVFQFSLNLSIIIIIIYVLLAVQIKFDHNTLFIYIDSKKCKNSKNLRVDRTLKIYVSIYTSVDRTTLANTTNNLL